MKIKNIYPHKIPSKVQLELDVFYQILQMPR